MDTEKILKGEIIELKKKEVHKHKLQIPSKFITGNRVLYQYTENLRIYAYIWRVYTNENENDLTEPLYDIFDGGCLHPRIPESFLYQT